MKILIGCEESQAVTIAFRKLGFEAYSCDLLPCSGGRPEWHLQMDVFEAIKLHKWGAAVFFPDCTYLTVTANKWLKDQPARASGALVGEARRNARQNAIDFFISLYNSEIPFIAMENPVGCISSVFKKPTQIVTPMEFGHQEPKKTCLWLKGFPKLSATHSGIVPEYHTTATGKRLPKWYAYADKSQGQAARAKIRSKTFQGIADAMAQQWGDFLINNQFNDNLDF